MKEIELAESVLSGCRDKVARAKSKRERLEGQKETLLSQLLEKYKLDSADLARDRLREIVSKKKDGRKSLRGSLIELVKAFNLDIDIQEEDDDF